MKTIFLDKPGHFRLAETEHPGQPGPKEALIRVRHVGICGTDLHAFRGRQPYFEYPRILGHELGVEVVAIGDDVTRVAVGDQCAVEPYLYCGGCIACRRGKTNCCVDMKVLGVQTDGGMREEILVPASRLHKSEKLPSTALATVEMLCIGAHAVGRAQIKAGENVLVIGLGPIGLGVAQFALLAGANVIGMELSERRKEFARQNLGIENFAPVGDESSAKLEAFCNGDLPTIVFDATGSARSMMNALNFVAHGGKMVYVGLVLDEITFSDPYLHSHEITILASRNATAADFAYVIKSLESGKINIGKWITHHANYNTLIEQFPSWLEPETGVVKAMLSF